MKPDQSKSTTVQHANILVVDDTPANLQVLTGMLKDRGYKVRPVPGGKLTFQDLSKAERYQRPLRV